MAKIQHITILGGGTSGWLSAAILSYQFRHQPVRITLVESEQIGTIGVGEATIPPFLDVLSSIGIDQFDFIRQTQSTFKLGIRFSGWLEQTDAYMHPFGQLGQPLFHQDFYQCWLKSYQAGNNSPLMAHSPAAVLAEAGGFMMPAMVKNHPMQASAYALHIDATLAARYFRNHAEKLGVERVEGRVEQVLCHENGHVSQLLLSDGSAVGGQLFLDCSGFSALISGQTLGAEFEDWSEFLTVNEAVTIQSEPFPEPPSYTESKAQAYGWSWHIPLQHRTGNGYVYDNRYIDSESAAQTLLEQLPTPPLSDPRRIRFRTGIRPSPWLGNCVAIGLAAGFLEPLESTAIHMVTRGVKHLLRLLPDRAFNPVLQEEYNRRMRRDFEEIRDFLVLHYCKNQRSDSEFWCYYQRMNLPERLEKKLTLFEENGGLIPGEDDLFTANNWYAVLEGLRVRPRRMSPLSEDIPVTRLEPLLQQIRQSLTDGARAMPSHRAFIDQHCPATKPGM
ncbi:Tryptophan 7-halogenase [Saliniradius amylolyticus]|uniref:Tryptophan 7-halogenase n=1 Tax=Saliniradius amylolyticus TaxID=2183582 RepID=A0A2S2DZ46_9ALTE|nr:tryptophan halogenase family protein [Saliniradius amylolyticus]AWL10678.1 Tryptophan 7-halogenase [Saliniradius amylolyticus]